MIVTVWDLVTISTHVKPTQLKVNRTKYCCDIPMFSTSFSPDVLMCSFSLPVNLTTPYFPITGVGLNNNIDRNVLFKNYMTMKSNYNWKHTV